MPRFQPSSTSGAAGRRGRAPGVRGFTLVEMLVTIAIVGILMSIILPSLQVARETARRSACLSNMNQIAKALINYESANERLPGWRNAVRAYTTALANSGSASSAAVSWAVPILPELGSQRLFDWYDQYTGTGDSAATKRVPIYLCPTSAAEVQVNAGLAYAVNAGTGAETLDSGSQFLGDGVFVDAAGHSDSARPDGVTGSWADTSDGRAAYTPVRTSLSLVANADGDSTTLMVAERSGPVAALAQVAWSTPIRAALPALVSGSTSTLAVKPHTFGHPPPVLTGTAPSVPLAATVYRMIHPLPVPESSGLTEAEKFEIIGLDAHLRYPSSRHRGQGACVAFCDGHTRFLSEKIDSWVYCQLLTADSKRLSGRAASWQTYDHDGSAGTANVPYLFDAKNVDK